MMKNAFLLALVGSAIGCAYQTPKLHVPEPIPALSPSQIELTELTVADGERDADPEVVASVRANVEGLLVEAAKRRGAAGGAPARVRVHVALEWSRDWTHALHEDGIAVVALPFYAVAFPLGMEMEREELSVDVTIEAGGRTYTGHGSGKKMGSLYARARRRALATAIENAIADAALAASRQVPSG